MALVRDAADRGELSETSRRIYTALRDRYIQFSLRARKRVDLPDDDLLNDEDNDKPSLRLDSIMAQMANLLHDAQGSVPANTHPCTSAACSPSGEAASHMNHQILLDRCLRLNNAFDEWQENLPESWRPSRNAQPLSIHHAIREAGLYNGLCDVYTSPAVANFQNQWRNNKILVLRLIKHCYLHLASSPTPSDLESDLDFVASIDDEIQLLIDGICASVPFILGSRTAIVLPHEDAEYPPVPSQLRQSAEYIDSNGQVVPMTNQLHSKLAAATGGWFLLLPLTAILSYASTSEKVPSGLYGTEMPLIQHLTPVELRQGQLQWIYTQVKRTQKVYMIP